MELNKYIDYTNLKANATKKDIEKLCKEAKENYFETSIDSFVPKELIKKDAFYHYRNITNYNSKAEFICPYCNKVH